MTLKTGVMIQLCHHMNVVNLKIYSNRKQLFYIVIIFHNIAVFSI